MNDLAFAISPLAGSGPDDAQRLSVRVQDQVLTRLLRSGSNVPEETALVPPERLAFWLIDNWWRLRWEPVPAQGMSLDWRAAHDMATIGGGYAWPRILIWGEGRRVGLSARSDPPGIVGPVRYLVDTLLYVKAAAFESAVDAFFERVLDANTGFGSDRAALTAQFEALQEERTDPDTRSWRKIEALLGFDPDEAPESLVREMITLSRAWGRDAVQEAAAACPGPDASRVLAEEIAAARSATTRCDLSDALRHCEPMRVRPGITPWQQAEQMAASLRNSFGIPSGPIRNRTLSELLCTGSRVFERQPSGRAHHYGVRLSPEGTGETNVLLRSRWPHDRRFEFARVLGDAIWAKSERLGPIGPAKTERQKFQRAFAQSLLCPHADLVDFLGTDEPSEGDLAEAARQFHVSERMVRTILVNKQALDRRRLEPPAWHADSIDRFGEMIEAA